MVDCIYVAASTLDARLTRICIASLRCFHPEVPIRLLAGGPLQAGLQSELKAYWDVARAAVPPGHYGWGFVKLEPLFGPPGERFLMLDSDIVVTGPILERCADSTADFLLDDESVPEHDVATHFYDWRTMRGDDAEAAPPQFLSNTGHWIGTSGVLRRDDFTPLMTWDLPRQLRYPKRFFPGEQGILNYVLNKKAARGEIRVDRRKIALWPGREIGITAREVAERTAPAMVVHWAGLKTLRHRDMPRADLLALFEDFYYRRVPLAPLRRAAAIIQNASLHAADRLKRLAGAGLRKLTGRRP